MYKLKFILSAVLIAFAGSASAWTTVPSGVVESCSWQYVTTYRGTGVYIVEYRSTDSSCRYRTKLYDYRVREIRYH
ncbi:hypothetical protein [Pseudoalteromonas luteoviolacea]|uniref:hypothetical protein n=1 Tax=Pseudoalteromonas luteoviolacea TaxID=43657 RepID=UPI00114759F7|nr:hypothetical protein [Pseudoalteromonas luteoviolacea]